MIKRLFFGAALLLSLPLIAARPSSPQWQRSLSDLQQDLVGLEEECATLKERLRNQETIIDDLRDQVVGTSAQTRDQLKGHSVALEQRMGNAEAAVQDIKQFRKQANEVATRLNQQSARLDRLEEMGRQQKHDLAKINNALQAIFKALDLPVVSESTTYRVKVGDSLGTIAQKHGTTVAEIKRLNHLKGDRIYSGQKLKLPEK